MKATLVIGIIAALSGCDLAQKAGALMLGLPTNNDILFWTMEERDTAFRVMGDFVPANEVASGSSPKTMKMGKRLVVSWQADDQEWDVDRYMGDQRSAGVIILHKGKIRIEEYGMDHSVDGNWTSFSVAKSLTSTLVGAAIQDGLIKSLQEPITTYIPELGGSGYEGVTVRQILTMTSGVRWNEDYGDPNSDVALFNAEPYENGVDPIISYMSRLEREAEPGTRWQYNTGETNLIGVLVARATGKSLADYLSEKVWKPFGMQDDAQWIVNEAGLEIGGCCLSIGLRDYALFGQFVLGGGIAAAQQVVPDDWFSDAGSKQADIGRAGRGYGYQWWTYDDGSFAAQGIFGQGIFIDPSRELVIASNSNWHSASDQTMKSRRDDFYAAVQTAIDDEGSLTTE